MQGQLLISQLRAETKWAASSLNSHYCRGNPAPSQPETDIIWLSIKTYLTRMEFHKLPAFPTANELIVVNHMQVIWDLKCASDSLSISNVKSPPESWHPEWGKQHSREGEESYPQCGGGTQMVEAGDNIASTRKIKRNGIMTDAQHSANFPNSFLGLGKAQSIISTMESWSRFWLRTSKSYRTQNTKVGYCYGICLTGNSSESCQKNEVKKCFSSVTRNCIRHNNYWLFLASSLVHTISGMHRQPLHKTKLLIKHSILINPQ